MKPSQLSALIAVAIRNKLQLLIESSPGIGKTSLVKQACDREKADLMYLHAGTQEPTDPKGLPWAYEKHGERIAEFVPFSDMSPLFDAKSLLVCLLDDFGQAKPDVQAAYMQLLHGGILNDKQVSKHVVFIACTNGIGDCSGVSGILEAIKSRFHSIVKLEPDRDDFVLYAHQQNWPIEIPSYISFAPQHLSDFKPTKKLTQSPSPRNWEHIAKWIEAGVTDVEVFEGAVGAAAAAGFDTFRQCINSLPDINGILMDPTGSVVPESPAARWMVCQSLARRMSHDNFEAVEVYTNRMDKLMQVFTVKDAHRLSPKILNCRAAQKWMATNRDVFV